MASIIKKKVGNRFYYYLVETKRVNGRPRIVRQVYLGSPNSIFNRLGSKIPSSRKAIDLLRTGRAGLERAKGGVIMAEKKRPSERRGGFGLGEIFKGIGNLVDLISDMMEEGETEVTRTGEVRGTGKLRDLKGVYGFNVKIGLGGTPTVETFGNIKKTQEGPVVEEVREPLTDVFDEEDYFRIIAELPGVEASEIKVDLKDEILTIAAEGRDRKYHKEVLLPSRAEFSPPNLLYQNGILEVQVRKATKG